MPLTQKDAWALFDDYVTEKRPGVSEENQDRTDRALAEIRSRRSRRLVSPLGALVLFEKERRGMGYEAWSEHVAAHFPPRPAPRSQAARDWDRMFGKNTDPSGWYRIYNNPVQIATTKTLTQLAYATGLNIEFLRALNLEDVSDANYHPNTYQDVLNRIAQRPELLALFGRLVHLDADHWQALMQFVDALTSPGDGKDDGRQSRLHPAADPAVARLRLESAT